MITISQKWLGYATAFFNWSQNRGDVMLTATKGILEGFSSVELLLHSDGSYQTLGTWERLNIPGIDKTMFEGLLLSLPSSLDDCNDAYDINCDEFIAEMKQRLEYELMELLWDDDDVIPALTNRLDTIVSLALHQRRYIVEQTFFNVTIESIQDAITKVSKNYAHIEIIPSVIDINSSVTHVNLFLKNTELDVLVKRAIQTRILDVFKGSVVIYIPTDLMHLLPHLDWNEITNTANKMYCSVWGDTELVMNNFTIPSTTNALVIEFYPVNDHE